jgi:hypothetical protein
MIIRFARHALITISRTVADLKAGMLPVHALLYAHKDDLISGESLAPDEIWFRVHGGWMNADPNDRQIYRLNSRFVTDRWKREMRAYKDPGLLPRF